MEPKESMKKRPADTPTRKSDLLASSRKDPPKKQKTTNADHVVGLADLIPEVLAIIASFSYSFYDLSKLREVSKMFNQAVSQCDTYCITTEDIQMGHHVAALRYVCQVAEGKTVLLDPGDYDLEAEINSHSNEPDDDFGQWYDYQDGLRFDEYVDTWKPGNGSLMIDADGITLRSSSSRQPASINFESNERGDEDDPLVHIALVIRANDVKLHDINTSGGLSMYVTGPSVSARNCIFGGTVTLRGSTASFEDCCICNGDNGGMSSSCDLTMTRCLFFDNYLNCYESYAVDFREGRATFHDTFIQCDSEKDAQYIFEDVQHYCCEPVFHPRKEKWLIKIKDQEEEKKETNK